MFLPRVKERRREIQQPDAWALLLLDAHSSHNNPALMEELQENNIDVLTYIAHASDKMQVLDCEASPRWSTKGKWGHWTSITV